MGTKASRGIESAERASTTTPLYPGPPLPDVQVEFRTASGSPGVLLDCVIPGAGADTTVFPWLDCQRLNLDPVTGVPGTIMSVAGGTAVTLGFLIWAWLDGQEYPRVLQGDVAAQERILGRDVLNRLRVLFDGAAGEVVFNP